MKPMAFLPALFGNARREGAAVVQPKEFARRLEQDLARLDPPMVAAALVISLSRSDRIEAVIGSPGCADALDEWLSRILPILQETDYLTLASENEIWVALPRLPSTAVATLAASNLVAALEPAVKSRHRIAAVRPAVGIAVGLHAGEKALEMLAAAAEACHRARAFSQRYCMVAGSDRGKLSDKELVLAVQKALMQNQLSVCYQPKVTLANGKTESVEALVRWGGAPEQAVSPGQIAAVAEQYGMMQELTRFVLNTALREFTSHIGPSGIGRVWINLSASMLHDMRLPQLLQQTIATWGVRPRHVGLEITESTLLTDVGQTIATLQALVELGFSLAIDDFGTGYSSLAYLRRFPVSELKIDKLFIDNMQISQPDRQIVQTIIDLAHVCKIAVVAEGVENRETLALLQDMKCDVVQGWVYAKAMPAAELAAWMRQNGGQAAR